ncbi:MAG: hypothetical protein K6D92_00210 [Erysipelotrichaceae bacterium]|jgi:hypothetical protein|nr:hypothetical protein [Erysipelotrichaceae bacterium]
MKVLFIGNSHTFVHYVPLRVKWFFEKHGKDIDVTMLTHPGVGLDYHIKQSQTYFDLMYGKYDAVVLQHNAHPFPGKESVISGGKAIAGICPEQTKIYLYMTWSEKNNPEGQKVMSEAYRELAAEIGAAVCPVGEWWWQIAEAYGEELYFADGEHSSVLGASLAAVVIGRTLLNMPVEKEELYQEARELAAKEQDPRMIDLVMKDGELDMA